jgi:hypothetical protein
MATSLGCGSSSSSDDAAKFVGAWTFDSGSVPAMCPPPLPSATLQLTGLVETITKVDTTHIKVEAGSGCSVNFSVSGSTAMAASGQTCIFNTQAFGEVSVAISTWTLSLSGATLSQTITGSAFGACTASGSGTATQHAGDGGAG